MFTNLGIIGYPLKHTISPKIHNYLLYKSNINGGYNCFELSDGNDLKIFIDFAKKYNFKGFNVTLPFKTAIFDFVDNYSKEVTAVRSVNTINFEDGKICAYNTDIYGFDKLLDMNNIDVTNKKIVVLGSGGAARSVINVLLKYKYNTIYIFNKNLERTRQLCADLQIKNNPDILISDLKYISTVSECDIIINTTSAGLYNDFNIDIGEMSVMDCAIDLLYSKDLTTFLKKIAHRCSKLIDGTDMLIMQAIRSFEVWTGKSMYSLFDDLKNYLKGGF